MSKVYNSPPSSISLFDKSTEYRQSVESNEMNPIVGLYTALLNLGVAAVPERKDQKYVRASNFVAINSVLGCLIYLGLSIFWEYWHHFQITALLTLLSIGVLIMNAFDKTTASRYIYLFGANTLVFISALLTGPSAYTENFLVLAVILPFIIFDLRNMFMIITGIAFPLILLSLYDFCLGFFISYHFQLSHQVVLGRINVFVEIFLLMSVVLQFVYSSRKTEQELDEYHQQMALQTSELRRSNSDLEQFAYIISHDLKTPVRNISSFMNLLLNKYGPGMSSEAQEFVNYSYLGAKRLERLIDDVLAYCRIGTNLPNPIPVNLNDVVKTIRFELNGKLSGSNALLSVSKDLPVVNNVHGSLMYHILLNLINNGLKFNKSENPEISINWTNSLNYYTFSVHDNGIGISKEYSSTIFQMFKRLHNEHEYEGTGIGLAICKKIVEYYHGEIWFESEEGKGTTFFFTIRKF